MAPWSKIARPFLGHFLVNLVKTMIGSALVGYGIAQLKLQTEDESSTKKQDSSNTSKDPDQKVDNKQNDEDDDSAARQRPTSPYAPAAFLERYISNFVMIGVGLYLVLPSLASQMLWEAAIPAITATEVAQDLATDSMFGYLKSWKPEKPNWPSVPTLGSGSSGTKAASSGAISVKNFVPSTSD